MYQTSLKSKEDYENGSCEAPLRTALMGTMAMELKARVAKTSEEHLHKLCLEAGWLTTDNKWQYLAWSPQEKKLMPTTKEPMTHTAILETMEQITELTSQPGLVHRFHSLRPLKETYQTDAVIMLLAQSIRPEANKLYSLFTRIQDLAATQLIGLRLRQERVKPSHLAGAEGIISTG
ncbi:unnamed protein product [Symbiodinium sp. CCMP2592]|nr:unnamed protein product [Symbiodinium sp. CCMP2592]